MTRKNKVKKATKSNRQITNLDQQREVNQSPIAELNQNRKLRHYDIATLVANEVNSGQILKKPPINSLVHPTTVFQHPTTDCPKCAVCTLHEAHDCLSESSTEIDNLEKLINKIDERFQNQGLEAPQELEYQTIAVDNMEYAVSHSDFQNLRKSVRGLKGQFSKGYRWLKTTLAWEESEYFYPLLLWRVVTNLSVDELQVLKLVFVLNNIPPNKKWEKVKQIKDIRNNKTQTPQDKLQSIFSLGKKADLPLQEKENQEREKNLKQVLSGGNSTSHTNLVDKLATLLGRDYLGLDEVFVAELNTFLHQLDSERTSLLYQIRALALDNKLDLYPELIQEETSPISSLQVGASFTNQSSTPPQDDLVRRHKEFVTNAQKIIAQRSTKTPSDRAEQLLTTIDKVFKGFDDYMKKLAETT